MNRQQLKRRNKQRIPGFGGDDSQFVNGGAQIINPLGPASHVKRLDRIPEWATDDKQVKELLLRSFPKLKEDPAQMQRAGRWAQVIHLYFRMGWTQSQIADEMNISQAAVNSMLRSISRARNGKQSGTGRDRNRKPKEITL
jgi:DNA-directed RNA polymerase specialized sigma24 family protein